jgi:hypothetical protein
MKQQSIGFVYTGFRRLINEIVYLDTYTVLISVLSALLCVK